MAEFSAADLQNRPDCDLVLEFITEEKDDLNFEEIVRGREDKEDSKDADQLERDIAQANTDLAKADQDLVGVEPGPARERLITKRMRADVRVRSLNERKATTGIVAVFKSDYEGNTITGKLAWLNQKEAEVTAKKATLPT